MERNFDKRLDTTKLVEGSKSVISLSLIIFLTKIKHQIIKNLKTCLRKRLSFVIKEN